MLRHLAVVLVISVLCAFTNLHAGDWPQWRGPARNGIASDEPKLAYTWPKEGPRMVWQYPAPSAAKGGLGSIVVAAGRALALISAKTDQPIDTRTLGDDQLKLIGLFPQPLPQELTAKVEAARTSDQRVALKPDDVGNWVNDWLAANFTEDQQKNFGSQVQDRLQRGRGALSLDVLASLSPLRGKEFATQADLDKWLVDNSIPDDVCKAVNEAAVKTRKVATDTVVCLDAADGAELWKAQYPGKPMDWGACGTPCIANGRCYIVISSGEALCLSVADGKEIWRVKTPNGVTHASFLVADGMAIIPADPLTAFDADTGAIIWKQDKVKTGENSPVLWRVGGKGYLICNTAKDAVCVELSSGNVLWTVPGGMFSTVAVAGDYLAILSNAKEAGLSVYKLSADNPADGPKKLWTAPIIDRASSPIIHDGCVYVVASGKAYCVKLDDGTIVWEQPVGGGEISSPILADGKIIAVVTTSHLAMLRASTEKHDVLAKAAIGITTCTSPAIAGGKLYLRLEKAIACYDLADQHETSIESTK